MALEAIAERRREHKRQLLYTHGLGRYEEVLWALDQIQTQLSPKSSTELRIKPRHTLQERLETLRRQRQPLRLEVDFSSGIAAAQLWLPSEGVCHYFKGVDRDLSQPDPLGVRGLYGVLHHYEVAHLTLSSIAEPHRSAGAIAVDLRQTAYRRQFRLRDRKGAKLRELIDRALWGEERLWLDEEMAECYSAIDPSRQDYLTELGLILMPDEEGRFELFVPGAFRRRDGQLPRKLLNQIALTLDRCLRTSPFGERFYLRPDAADESHRKLFRRLAQGEILKESALKRRLRTLQINYRTTADASGEWRYIEFYRVPPRVGSVAERELWSPPNGNAEAAGDDAAQATLSRLTEEARELPTALRCLANHVLITRKAQPVPQDLRYRRWLSQHEVVSLLSAMGLVVSLRHDDESDDALHGQIYLAPIQAEC